MPRTIVRHEEEHLYATPPTTEAGQQLSAAILHMRRAERIQTQRAQEVSGLPSLDLTALRYLVQGFREGRNLSPKDLIVMLNTSSATVTNVVERLVGRSLLTREQHPTDRRAHYLRPTPEAICRVDDSYGAHHAAIVDIINTLSDDEAECAASVISRLAEAMDALSDREDR